MTIVIHGTFDRPGDEVGEIIDNALHDAGLCGCPSPANGYLLSVKSSTTSDRHARSAQHDGRETARAWIVDGVAGSSVQGIEERRDRVELMSGPDRQFGSLSLEERTILEHLVARIEWAEARLSLASQECERASEAVNDARKAVDHICRSNSTLAMARAETRGIIADFRHQLRQREREDAGVLIAFGGDRRE